MWIQVSVINKFLKFKTLQWKFKNEFREFQVWKMSNKMKNEKKKKTKDFL